MREQPRREHNPHVETPPDDPSPAPPSDSGESKPLMSTPVTLAVLSLAGVLGGGLMTNWDKIFGSANHAAKAPAVAAAPAPAPAPAPTIQGGAHSPVMGNVSGPVTINYGAPSASAAGTEALAARLQGSWLSEPAQHPYQRDRRFRLRLVLRAEGGELSGQVADVDDNGQGPVTELPLLKPGTDGLDFQLERQWCCEGGQAKAFQVFHQLRPLPNGQLSLTRRNNAPGGGAVERFTLTRG